MHARTVAVLAVLAALAAPAARAAAPAPPAAERAPRMPRLALPFIEDDYARALAEARARDVPLFVESWAPW